MANTAERVILRTSKPKATVAALAAAASLLAGCSTDSKKDVAPVLKPVPTTIAISPTTTEATPFNSASFQSNPERNARIDRAAQSFGTIVLEQSRKPDSPWGPFDAFCSPGLTFGGSASGREGWVSQGYKPTAGQNCAVQHNPQYGGEEMQVYADVGVGAGGTYNDKIEAVGINNSFCTTNIMNDGSKVGWDVEISNATATHIKDTVLATSLAQAEAIDSQALTCLARTKP
jgi:hypothetical protein